MLPWMDKSEIGLIISYLKPSYKMFEWGCGGSTLYFSKYVSLYRSVEHNEKWFNKISPKIEKNTELYLYNNTDNYISYINAVKKHNTIYDAILVDGRQRLACAIAAKDFIKPNGILFVHDYFNREYYSDIENFYVLVDSIKNTSQTLAVFKNEIYN